METLPCGLRSVVTTASFPISPSSVEVSTPTTPSLSLPDGRLVLRAICEKALVGNSLERRKTERKSIVVVETSTMANGSTRGSRFIEPASNTMLLSIIAKARVMIIRMHPHIPATPNPGRTNTSTARRMSPRMKKIISQFCTNPSRYSGMK